MKTIRNRRIAWTLNVLLAFYFGSYLILTLRGDYRGPYRSYSTHPDHGELVMRERFIWQPLHARLDRYGYNWSGAVFSPLILLDRWLWHRSKVIDVGSQ